MWERVFQYVLQVLMNDVARMSSKRKFNISISFSAVEKYRLRFQLFA